jgi:hypothetical protein
MKLVSKGVKPMKSTYKKDRSVDIKIAPMIYLFGMISNISVKDAQKTCLYGIAPKRLVNNASYQYLSTIKHPRHAKHAT